MDRDSAGYRQTLRNCLMNAAQWNALYPIGTDVFLIEGGFTGEDVEEVHTRTVSAAWDPLHCDTLVELDGVEGPRLLNRVRPVTPKPKHLLQQPFGLLEKMRLSEALDMMASHGVAKVASVFSSQDDEPVFAVVMLTGDQIQDYLDAFETIDRDSNEIEQLMARCESQLEGWVESYNLKPDPLIGAFANGFAACLRVMKEEESEARSPIDRSLPFTLLSKQDISRIVDELESVLAGYAIGHDKSDHSQTSHSAGFVAGFRNCLGRLKEKVEQTVTGP
ncbi:hypothetical protein [Alloalcanivorax xenomutans]|uniref:Uncharacterized protein n=1 Tax=Alloalcanivorax xenomutans TaxID=1094342 RepID=A0A9Q3W7D4_9GAMM|nr:hypothetical protein [Alloalcanivorax xenomutans]MCE7510280.1 hypothetical protein [Alloalcanivorax xenomutans]